MFERNVKISKNLNHIPTPGKHLRLLCLTGKDKGTFYYLLGKRIVMGRENKSDIQVLDHNASRRHAELIILNNKVILTDLDTENGTYVNDLQVTQCQLKSGDNVVIGRNVYKFQSFVQENELEEEGKQFQKQHKDSLKSEGKKKEKRINPVILIAVLGALLLFLEETPETKKEVKRYYKKIKEKSSPKNKIEIDDNIKKRFSMYIHRGVREYREENYLQAVREFDMALTLNPTGGRASFYKRKAVKKIMKTIDDLFIQASRERVALRYNSALVSLCGVIKFLAYYENKENEEQAEKMIKEIHLEMGREDNENPCSS